MIGNVNNFYFILLLERWGYMCIYIGVDVYRCLIYVYSILLIYRCSMYMFGMYIQYIECVCLYSMIGNVNNFYFILLLERWWCDVLYVYICVDGDVCIVYIYVISICLYVIG